MSQVVNFGKVTVLSGHSSSDTSIALQAGNGALLPVAPFNVVWWNSAAFADPSDDPNKEIVRVTAGGGGGGGDTLTVTRAQEGTAASSKNTAGGIYKMIAGFTAKGPEQIGIGASASLPTYIEDVRSSSIQSQVHITDHDSDDGGWLMGFHGNGLYCIAGAYYNGTNWIAKETSASFIQVVNSGNALDVYRDSGLTVGNSFTPTLRVRIDGSGNIGLSAIGTPNVSLDTSGAIATRFLTVTLVNGLNSNIAIGTSGNIRASGPTGAYSLGGFANGFDGRELFFFNPLSQTVQIIDEDASSTAANRIASYTSAGRASVFLYGGTGQAQPSWAKFKYDSTLSRWILEQHS